MTNSQSWNEKGMGGNEPEKKREGAPGESADRGKRKPGEQEKAREEKQREGHTGAEKAAPAPGNR
jgi:hypothetical protein